MLMWPAASALGTCQLQPTLSVPALINHVADPHPYVRIHVIYALAAFGAGARAAVPQLIERLQDSNEQVREAANIALSKIAPEVTEGPSVPRQ